MATEFLTEHGTKRENVYLIDPRDIVVDYRRNLSRNGETPKVDEKLMALGRSMMPQKGRGDGDEGTSGQLNPVLIRKLPDHKPELLGGFRRHAAAMWLIESGECPNFKLRATKCDLSDEEVAFVNLDENMQREDPEPIQLAHAIRHLMGLGYSMATICNRLRKSRTYLEKLLKLLSLPAAIQEAGEAGEVSVAAMAELTELPRSEAIEVFNAAKAATAERVKAKALKNGKLVAEDLPTPTGTPPAAAKAGSGKGPVIQSGDVKRAVRERKDAALDAGGEVDGVKLKNRPTKEIIACINDLATPINASKEGKKLAKMLCEYMAGIKTADQLSRAWFKQFPVIEAE